MPAPRKYSEEGVGAALVQTAGVVGAGAHDRVRPYLPENYVLGWVQLFSPTPDLTQMVWGTFSGLA